MWQNARNSSLDYSFQLLWWLLIFCSVEHQYQDCSCWMEQNWCAVAESELRSPLCSKTQYFYNSVSVSVWWVPAGQQLFFQVSILSGGGTPAGSVLPLLFLCASCIASFAPSWPLPRLVRSCSCWSSRHPENFGKLDILWILLFCRALGSHSYQCPLLVSQHQFCILLWSALPS